MNKQLKKVLQESFLAPEPQKKREFFQTMPFPPISFWEFLKIQAAYIRKWVWLLSSLLFFAAFFGAEYTEKNMLWILSALVPLLALSILTECGRSEACGMAELELSTRFSLKSVWLARLGMLGIANVLLLVFLMPFAWKNSPMSLFQTGVYLLCPYLLTVFLGLAVTRKFHGREASYMCLGIALTVSVGNCVLSLNVPLCYEKPFLPWWFAALVLCGIGVFRESRQMIKQTEEFLWSL